MRTRPGPCDDNDDDGDDDDDMWMTVVGWDDLSGSPH